ncbi:MAG: 50S ribosomal protein L21e [Deltaproteobacteria bacterium]|nr:MAG: 50S ribosomal protein L21e [Deltaproteobacteria bacterium]
MVRASRGSRRSTRNKLKKKPREKFKPEDYLVKFKPGERVYLSQDPSSHRGMPHPFFKAMLATVKEKRGRSYVVTVRTGKSTKELHARPEHLKHAKTK